MPIKSEDTTETLTGITSLLEEQGIVNNKKLLKNLIKYIRKGCRDIPRRRDLALLVLENDFISPISINKAFGEVYSKKEVSLLFKNLPNLGKLIWLKENNFILMPKIWTPMNLWGIMRLYPELFENTAKSWLQMNHTPLETLDFTKDRMESGGWIAVKKGQIERSSKRTFNEQERSLKKFEVIPNVTELIYSIVIFHKIRGGGYIPKNYLVTQSSADPNYKICVEYSVNRTEEISISNIGKDVRNNCVGISPIILEPKSIKFN